MWSDGSSTAKAVRARAERRALRRALKEAGIDAPAFYEEVTDSTMAVAGRLAQGGTPEWTLVVAGQQTAGRGRLGRSWVSEPGSSLLFSFVLRPALEPERALLITLLAGVVMAEACRELSGADVRCKWPNDLVVDGRKLAGILTEATVRGGRIEHAVVGIGLNLTAAPIEGAAALGDVRPSTVLTEFFRRFRELYGAAGPAFAHAVVTRYAPLSATLGERVRALRTDGRAVEGKAVDIDPNGNLVIDTAEGRASVAFGEVTHLR